MMSMYVFYKNTKQQLDSPTAWKSNILALFKISDF